MDAAWSMVMVFGAVELEDSRRAVVVSTPLDMITWLEAGDVSEVVVAASQAELAEFVLETYPTVRVEVR